MPVVIGALRAGIKVDHVRWLGIVYVVEEKELHCRAVLGEHTKVNTVLHRGSAEGEAPALLMDPCLFLHSLASRSRRASFKPRTSGFKACNFAQPAQVPLCLAKLRCEKRLHEIPRHLGSYGAATQAEDVHVIVLNALPRREMVVDERGADAPDFVGAHGRTNAAAADRDAAFHFARGHRLREGHHVAGIVVFRVQRIGAEILDLMTRCMELRDESFFQREPTVICRNAHAHVRSSRWPRNQRRAPVLTTQSSRSSLRCMPASPSRTQRTTLLPRPGALWPMPPHRHPPWRSGLGFPRIRPHWRGGSP